MLHALDSADRALFLWLNGRKGAAIDALMEFASGKLTWVWLYALLLGWLVWLYRYRVWQVVLAAVAVIALSDQTASHLLKPWVHRLRPCHVPELARLIYAPEGCGGQFGFVSSHAANSFGLAMLIWLLQGRRHHWLWLGFLWAGLVSYSRIYLGKHYPLDILGGAGVGVFWAFAAGWVLRGRLSFRKSRDL